MSKYVFKPYSTLFPTLFKQEEERIKTHLKEILKIEHVGSTAVKNLGGKGIIDIAIAVKKEAMDAQIKQLESLGYQYRPTFSTLERYYFVTYRPDPEETERRYHIHLTYPESSEWRELIGFRDYLRHHPEAAEEYAEIKKNAVKEANQDGERYRALKKPLFEKVASSYHLEYLDSIPQEGEEVLFRGISEEAFRAKGLSPIRPFSLFLKDFQGRIVAGVTAAYFYQSLYVDSIWIDLALRRQGWGSKLMQEAEKIGKRHGAHFVIVHTMDFEALAFYEKLGYFVEFVREGYEKNSKMFMLRKTL
jgi:GrpB-like predicted nucleotidyltransferase (UPF0157 family)